MGVGWSFCSLRAVALLHFGTEVVASVLHPVSCNSRGCRKCGYLLSPREGKDQRNAYTRRRCGSTMCRLATTAM